MNTDVAALFVSAALLLGYHLFLRRRLRQDPLYTIQAVSALARERWVAAVMCTSHPTMNSTTSSAPALSEKANRLRNFPVSFFAVVMGLAGLTIAWRKAEVVFTLPFAVSCLVHPITVLVFFLLAAVYLLKVVRHPDEVFKELNHPIKLNFFPTVSIGPILLSIASMEGNPHLARWLWLCGTALHFGLTLYVMTVWIHHTKFEVTHLNPAWFIPVVANILVPIAGVRFYSPEISWFVFSVGLVFWIVLFTIVLYRLFFHAPLPARLMPTTEET